MSDVETDSFGGSRSACDSDADSDNTETGIAGRLPAEASLDPPSGSCNDMGAIWHGHARVSVGLEPQAEPIFIPVRPGCGGSVAYGRPSKTTALANPPSLGCATYDISHDYAELSVEEAAGILGIMGARHRESHAIWDVKAQASWNAKLQARMDAAAHAEAKMMELGYAPQHPVKRMRDPNANDDEASAEASNYRDDANIQRPTGYEYRHRPADVDAIPPAGAKPAAGRYECRFARCDKSFKQPTARNDHEAVKHLGCKRYICGICNKASGTKRNLNKHICNGGRQAIPGSFPFTIINVDDMRAAKLAEEAAAKLAEEAASIS